MFKVGHIISCEEVREYVKSLSEIDEDMLDMYTNIFSSYICKKVNLSELHYDRINKYEEIELIEEYAEDINDMPPIVTSPIFEGKRIVYDGCHRCYALEINDIKEVMALVPYETIDGRMVEDMETAQPNTGRCKHGDCEKGKCCLICEYNHDCGGICSHCFNLGNACQIVSKNVSLFCDGVWQ